MSQHPLRLVVDQYDDTAPAAIELQPAAGAALHIHLHMSSRHGSISPPAAVLAPESKARGRSGRGVIRPLLVGVAGVLIAVVAFDLGGRSAEGHAQALAAGRARAEGLASLAAPPPVQPARSGTCRSPSERTAAVGATADRDAVARSSTLLRRLRSVRATALTEPSPECFP